MERPEFVGKEMIVGFGADLNRLVVELVAGGGVTFFASKDVVEMAEKEPITLKITPGAVICEEFGFIFPYHMFFKLGRHRFLVAISRAEGDLVVVYLPDENDLETCSSEFMMRIQPNQANL